MVKNNLTQKERLLKYVQKQGIVRAFELREMGISATAISRMVESGEILRIGRGLYQAINAEIDLNANFAEVAKRTPRAVVCLVSALAFHGLTDQLPRKVWFAIGAKDWEPTIPYPPVRVVRFREPYYSQGIEKHVVSNVSVRIYSPVKSIADAFRNPRLVNRSLAIECLKSVLDNRYAKPGEIMEAARINGAGNIIQPYLEALTSNG